MLLPFSSLLLPSPHHLQPQSDHSQPPLFPIKRGFVGTTTDFFSLLPPWAMRFASPPSPFYPNQQIFMVTYPGLCNVPSPAPAPLDPGGRRPYFETFQYILVFLYRRFHSLNNMLGGGNTKECQRYPMKIEPRVSAGCKGVVATLDHSDAGGLVIKGKASPSYLCAA